ncbi:uncharacterized protein LOC143549401 [Bidens hawaiensis]|uniref:uncharacterized protein LOC143549401 n=1 Tax=Bidens hawaiensis TaxID=980011 RepID=UPI00404999D6
MADLETLGILEEIQALVSDNLQVVSYKWLSRNFSVPSDTAKRLLQEFVEKNGSQLEVIYSLSGWLKNNPEAYHVKLVLGSKLSEIKQEFGDGCSVQVYSVQSCVPKDPAVIWNAEYVQSEELFKEPANAVNCLRDNRFCGVSNSFVKRNTEGAPVINSAGPQLKSVGVHGQSKTSSINQTPNILIGKEKEQSNPKPNQAINVQSGTHKEQVPQNKKKLQNDKTSSGTSSSLASMWGRASAKPKGEPASVKTETIVPISNDAQVRANESVEDESSDDGDDNQQMNFKRASNGEGNNNNRKRRVVMDYSDEDDNVEDAVNLASPDPPKKQVSVLDSKKSSTISGLESKNLDFDEEKEVKNEKVNKIDHKSVNENKRSHENEVKQEDKTSDVVKNESKKRKVLKTRIDDRGREVTEVVWEDDEKETKHDDNTRKDKGDNNTTNNVVVNRPVAAAPKKSPAVSHATGKAGNKKTNAKDPKQGNIMSFFKKKV